MSSIKDITAKKYAARLIRRELDQPGHVKVVFIKDSTSAPQLSGSPCKKTRWSYRKSTEQITVGDKYKTIKDIDIYNE
jgi:hypothetical protein